MQTQGSKMQEPGDGEAGGSLRLIFRCLNGAAAPCLMTWRAWPWTLSMPLLQLIRCVRKPSRPLQKARKGPAARGLGYPGLVHLQAKARRNPAEVLLPTLIAA